MTFAHDVHDPRNKPLDKAFFFYLVQMYMPATSLLNHFSETEIEELGFLWELGGEHTLILEQGPACLLMLTA